jgi:tripartite-type tricarboxylate transporter receptor subunit TctC
MNGLARAAVVAITLAGLPAPAQAQDWPAKPVRIISPFAPGGSSDTLARLLADHLSQKLGQQFYVENRGGAAGLIGSAAVAGSEPDGYTFLMSSVGTHVIAPATNPNAGFDPIKNFTHVAYLGGPPNVMVVHPSLGVSTLAQLADKAAQSKEPLPYVSPGPGTLGNLVAELWAARAGARLAHIAYKGSGQALNDLVAGHVQVGSITWTSVVGQLRAGTLVPLAVSSANRMPDFPDLPTMKELGYPELVAPTWFGVSGPAGLPPRIVHRAHAAIIDAMNTPAMQQRLRQEGIETEAMSPDQFAAFIVAEAAKWTPIARAAIGGSATR